MKIQICRGIKKGGKSTSEYKGREVGLFVIARNVFGLPNTADESASSLGDTPNTPKSTNESRRRKL